MIRQAAIALAFLAVAPWAHAQSATLFSFEQTIKVSKWQTRLGDLQRRLNEALAACGKAGVGVDYKLGSETRKGIARLRECPGFGIAGEEGSQVLTEAMWNRLWPGEDAPGLAQRIGVLVFHFESTDYDRFLWNVGQRADPNAFGTWGPFGATLGAGGEVQTIAREIEKASPGLVTRAFENADPDPANPPKTSWRADYCASAARPAPTVSGAALLLGLAAPLTASDRDKLRDEFCSDAHYLLWYSAFRTLAAEAAARQAFDEHYAAQNRKIVARLAKIYSDRGWVPTEIDWAYFLDRSTQFTGDLDAVARDLAGAPADATAAQRRLIASRASRPSNDAQRRLRVGRDMTFVVDGLDASELTEEEVSAWKRYGAIRAQQAGLSDDRTVAASPF